VMVILFGGAIALSEKARSVPHHENKLARMSNEILCGKITSMGNWDMQEVVKNQNVYVGEAKKRGLGCGVLAQEMATSAPESSYSGPTRIDVSTLRGWRVRRDGSGKCFAEAIYVDDHNLRIDKLSQGNFNTRYLLRLRLQSLLPIETSQITIQIDEAPASKYRVEKGVDANNLSLKLNRDFSSALGSGHNLYTLGDNADLIYRFSLRGSNAALESLKQGDC
jgi:hypothetical protein